MLAAAACGLDANPISKANVLDTTRVSGIIGALIGGITQYYVTGSLEAGKQLLQMQISTYADFANGQAALARAKDAKQEDDANLKIRAAIVRIIIFSSSDVVNSVAAFISQTRSNSTDRVRLQTRAMWLCTIICAGRYSERGRTRLLMRTSLWRSGDVPSSDWITGCLSAEHFPIGLRSVVCHPASSTAPPGSVIAASPVSANVLRPAAGPRRSGGGSAP